MEKRFIIRKRVMAENIQDAIKKEKRAAIYEIWVDEEWMKLQDEQLKKKMGF
jgi:hypothetical protein